ncbi:hypothetical protein MIND_00608800 [Mycena indigotica]|uniref:HMG box domain-containing protein n=1 Tax=Mycena indigotica TaxID=2126181 RepID=A0A8H6SSB1_9AGAR|nr:uncharacterized protein MIND_00608800 [Mycena indigotica]KAF7303791.1 hypothetical protein MIND_00608800 [Mycena indigotica]
MSTLRVLSRAVPGFGLRVRGAATLSRFTLVVTTRRNLTSTTRLAFPAAARKPAVKPKAEKKPAKAQATGTKATKTEESKARKTATTKVATKAPKTKTAKPTAKRVITTKKNDKGGKTLPKKPILANKVPKSLYPPRYGPGSFSLYYTETGNPNLPTVKRVLAAAAVWRQLPESEKQVYIERSNELKRQARIARDKWFEETDPAILRRINAQRKAKNKKRIHNRSEERKRPLNPYLLFSAQYRAENPSIYAKSFNEVGKDVGAAWKALDALKREAC